MRRTLFSLMLLATPFHARGQGSPEEAAIVEVLTAKDTAAVEKHLPKALSDALDSVDKATREQLLSRARSVMEQKGLKVAPANDGRALLAFDVDSPEADIKHFELVAEKRISNGAEAVLLIACVAREKTGGLAEVWMRLEDGEWRITQLTDPEGNGSFDLEDPDLIFQLVHQAQYQNELAAISGLREINTALVAYSAAYGEFPQSLEMLCSATGEEPSREHAALMDLPPANANARFGYKFQYERTSIDSYTVTATPLESGKSGTRNFFTDESAVIRFTSEDRSATVNDPPLEGGHRYRR